MRRTFLSIRHGDFPRLFGDEPQAASLVEDRALLLSGPSAHVSQYHAELRYEHNIDYRVLVVDDGGDINRTAHR